MFSKQPNLDTSFILNLDSNIFFFDTKLYYIAQYAFDYQKKKLQVQDLLLDMTLQGT